MPFAGRPVRAKLSSGEMDGIGGAVVEEVCLSWRGCVVAGDVPSGVRGDARFGPGLLWAIPEGEVYGLRAFL